MVGDGELDGDVDGDDEPDGELTAVGETLGGGVVGGAVLAGATVGTADCVWRGLVCVGVGWPFVAAGVAVLGDALATG